MEAEAPATVAEPADLVIMNPPFTRDSLRHDQFSREDEKKLKAREKELFDSLDAGIHLLEQWTRIPGAGGSHSEDRQQHNRRCFATKWARRMLRNAGNTRVLGAEIPHRHYCHLARSDSDLLFREHQHRRNGLGLSALANQRLPPPPPPDHKDRQSLRESLDASRGCGGGTGYFQPTQSTISMVPCKSWPQRAHRELEIGVAVQVLSPFLSERQFEIKRVRSCLRRGL